VRAKEEEAVRTIIIFCEAVLLVASVQPASAVVKIVQSGSGSELLGCPLFIVGPPIAMIEWTMISVGR
jgi:hypothetical protein